MVLPAGPSAPPAPESAMATGQPGNPLHGYLDAYCEWALAAGFSEHTIATRRAALIRFIAWSDERGITKPVDIARPLLERYQRHLYHYRKSNDAPLSVIAQLGLYLS